MKQFFLILAFVIPAWYLQSQNLVPNSSFENNDLLFPNAPTNLGQIEHMQDWKNFASSDWFNQNGFFGTYQPTGPWTGSGTQTMLAKTGNKYIGFGSCEGAQIKLSSKIEKKWVVFSFWYAIRSVCSTKLNVYLVKDKTQNSAVEDNCSSPNIQDAEHYEIDIDQGTHAPGVWYFYQSKPMYVSAHEYEWFAIKGKNIPGAFGSPEYVYLDEVTVESKDNLCDLVCSPNLGSISHTPYPNAMAATGVPWQILVTNATNIDFNVVSTSQAGQTVYHQSAEDVNGLKDINHPNYQFLWRGRDINGNLLQQNVYNYSIRIRNCNEDFTDYGSITYITDDVDKPQPPDFHNTDLINCCPETTYVQNKTYLAAYTIEKANNKVIIGSNVTSLIPTGPVVIGANRKVKYIAKEVVINSGFSIAPGGEIEIYLTENCANTPQKLYNYTRERVNVSDNLTGENINDNSLVYPNPSIDGKFYLKNIKLESIKDVCVSNLLGIKIDVLYNHGEIDLLNSQSGNYICTINFKDGHKRNIQLIKN